MHNFQLRFLGTSVSCAFACSTSAASASCASSPPAARSRRPPTRSATPLPRSPSSSPRSSEKPASRCSSATAAAAASPPRARSWCSARRASCASSRPPRRRSSATTTHVAGVLRAAPRFASAHRVLLPRAIAALAQRHPDLRVTTRDMEPEDSLPALKLGELDLALAQEYAFAPTPADPAIERTDLLEDPVRVALPEDHPLAAEPERSTCAALEHEPWIAGREGSFCHLVVIHSTRAAGYEPRLDPHHQRLRRLLRARRRGRRRRARARAGGPAAARRRQRARHGRAAEPADLRRRARRQQRPPGDRGDAHSAHRALSTESSRPGKRASSSSRRSRFTSAVPSARCSITPVSRRTRK